MTGLSGARRSRRVYAGSFGACGDRFASVFLRAAAAAAADYRTAMYLSLVTSH